MRSKIIIILIFSLALLLRFFQLGTFPIGVYSDEAAYGYNAFSLLQTGRDEYGIQMPLTFESFGDFKPPLSAWLNIPTIMLFDLNEFSVRFPSALLGSLTVLVVYFVVLEIFKEKFRMSVAAVAAAMLAISPWHILFSRSNMLVGIEAFCISCGFLFFLKSFKKPYLMLVSTLFFCAAVYAYYGSRITVPLILISLLIVFRYEIYKIKKFALASIIVGFILLLPLSISVFYDPSTLTGRARTVSIFFNEDIKLRLWEAHTLDGGNYPPLLSRFFNNKPYYYFNDFFRRYFQHFSPSFLFLSGDRQMPFDLPKMGVLYLIELPFFLIGLYLLIKNRTKKNTVLLIYLLISPVVASFTFITPAANRAFNMVVPWTIISAYGLVSFIHYFKASRRLAISLITLCFTFSLIHFLYVYFYFMPYVIPNMWHAARREMVEKLTLIEGNYNSVVLSESPGPTYIWLLFYKKYDPQKYWQDKLITKADNLGWRHVEGFDKYKINKTLEWEKTDKDIGSLYVGFENEIPDEWSGVVDGTHYRLEIIDKVLYPNNYPAFKFARLIEY